MSSIETFLNYIQSKKWAGDVRTAIVNAIRQCYDDVNSPTLKTDALQRAIQTKIDAGQMAALTIGDGTITNDKLQDLSVTRSKLGSDLIDILHGLERGEIELIDKSFILGFYPMADGHMGITPSARMFVYPIENNAIYYVTWSTGTNKFRTAMGNVPADSITEETMVYNYTDNSNTEHENYPVINNNDYKYLYIYAGNTSNVTVDSVIVIRKVGYDINSYYASDDDAWE